MGGGNRSSQAFGTGATTTFSYDGFNRLVSAGRVAAFSYTNPNYADIHLPAGTTSYSFNALGQRTAKSGPLGSTRFVYGGQNTLMSEVTSGQWTDHIWMGNEPIGFVRGGQLYFTHADRLGRPEVVTDTNGQHRWISANYAYDRAVLGSTIGDYNLGFPGQYYDAETGFWYNGFRDYDGRTGAYLQSDPIGLAGGLNTYGYVGANPISAVDFFGLQGHHYVPRQIINRYNFSPEARGVFQNSTTGKVQHYFDRGHRSYNQAVVNHVEDFLKRNNIDPSKMTAQQAQQCLDEVKASQQPEIKDYLQHLRNGGGLFRAPMICLFCSILLPMPEESLEYNGPPVV